jgi:single-stranded DNA-binding protein
MIDALLAGKLYGQPAQRTAKNGSAFAVCKVRVATAGADCIFVSVIAFKATAIAALMALQDGDSCALSGELTPKVWTDKEGVAKPALDLVAHTVLTAFHVARKRKAVTEPAEPERARAGGEW